LPASSLYKKSSIDLLTDKEKKVLSLLVAGKSYKSIALDMDITVDTVKFHIKNTYSKLQVTNKEDAINKAISEK